MQRPRKGVCTAPRFVPGCGQTCWDRALNCRQQGASTPLPYSKPTRPRVFTLLGEPPLLPCTRAYPSRVDTFQGLCSSLGSKRPRRCIAHRGNSKSPSRAELLGKDIQPLLAVQRPRRSIGSEALSSIHSYITHSLIHAFILAC